jgi:hypothetical protein
VILFLYQLFSKPLRAVDRLVNILSLALLASRIAHVGEVALKHLKKVTTFPNVVVLFEKIANLGLEEPGEFLEGPGGERGPELEERRARAVTQAAEY